MKPRKTVDEAIRRRLLFTAAATWRERLLAEMVHAQRQPDETTPAPREPVTRRTIGRSPIVKLGIAAAIVTTVGLGIVEFIGTGSKSGVVWAEVARKVQASRGLTVRCTESFPSVPESLSFLNDADYAIKYVSPTHSRTDEYKGGQIIHTDYTDFSDSDTDTLTQVYHIYKRYRSRTYEKSKYEFLLEQHDDWLNPMYLIQTILSCEHRKLGPKTIEGVLCEGIETTDPAALGPLPIPVTRLEVEMRLWVNAETEYPVLFESETKMSAELNGEVMVMASEGVMDRFQWDVELDPSIFEPNIPPDYRQM